MVCLVNEVRFRWSPHLPQQSPMRRSLERQSWPRWHLGHSDITPFGGSYTAQGSKDSPVWWEHSIIREHDTARRAQDRRAVGIERTEYYARQAAARELARERGFSALVAWSRGGSTQDHYADVYYLTGFYTHQPFIPDESGRWRAHGHTALVLPLEGPGTLLVDMTELQDPKPAAERVRFTEDLELPSIGWQLFVLGNSQSDSTAFQSSLDTYATRLLTEPLSRVAHCDCGGDRSLRH